MQLILFIFIALFVLNKILFFLTPFGAVLWLITIGIIFVFNFCSKPNGGK